MVSDAKKRANKKYDAAHMTNIACKVTREYAEALKAKAAQSGVSVHAILKSAADDFMQSDRVKISIPAAQIPTRDGETPAQALKRIVSAAIKAEQSK